MATTEQVRQALAERGLVVEPDEAGGLHLKVRSGAGDDYDVVTGSLGAWWAVQAHSYTTGEATITADSDDDPATEAVVELFERVVGEVRNLQQGCGSLAGDDPAAGTTETPAARTP